MSDTVHLELSKHELVALYSMVKHGIPFVDRATVRSAADILDRLRPQLNAQNVPDDFINSLMR